MRNGLRAFPPRYAQLLRFTLAAALLRLAPLIPAVLAYFFVPVRSWLRLGLALVPALWVLIVCPARVRYGQALAAFVKNPSTPLRARALLQGGGWIPYFRARWKHMRANALPLVVLTAVCAVLLLVNSFFGLSVVLSACSAVATGLGTVAAFLPRLMAGEAVWQPAGLLGGVAVLFVVFGVCLALFGVGSFRTSALRFGQPAGAATGGAMKPLLRENLTLWLPTLLLLAALLAFYYRETGLLLANFLGAAPLFSARPGVLQLALMAVCAVSYFIYLPVRKYNTARFAAGNGEMQ